MVVYLSAVLLLLYALKFTSPPLWLWGLLGVGLVMGAAAIISIGAQHDGSTDMAFIVVGFVWGGVGVNLITHWILHDE